jgi:biotin transport system substrate-specific component
MLDYLRSIDKDKLSQFDRHREDNQLTKPQASSLRPSMTVISRSYILMWTIVGLFLTIGANFLTAYITSSPWQWLGGDGVTVRPLGSNCQVGAVLLVSCLGGRTAGVLTQVTYLLIGLFWLKVFNDGGGIEYIQKPTFGYLLGFIPGSWICGWLAFKRQPQLEYLGLSCLCGLVTIHFIGIIYLALFQLINWQQLGGFKLFDAIASYSIYPFISQLVLGCAATSIAFIMRRVMFY